MGGGGERKKSQGKPRHPPPLPSPSAPAAASAPALPGKAVGTGRCLPGANGSPWAPLPAPPLRARAASAPGPAAHAGGGAGRGKRTQRRGGAGRGAAPRLHPAEPPAPPPAPGREARAAAGQPPASPRPRAGAARACVWRLPSGCRPAGAALPLPAGQVVSPFVGFLHYPCKRPHPVPGLPLLGFQKHKAKHFRNFLLPHLGEINLQRHARQPLTSSQNPGSVRCWGSRYSPSNGQTRSSLGRPCYAMPYLRPLPSRGRIIFLLNRLCDSRMCFRRIKLI